MLYFELFYKITLQNLEKNELIFLKNIKIHNFLSFFCFLAKKLNKKNYKNVKNLIKFF